MWAHQIKTPIFALRLLLREEPEENRESGASNFRIEQYVGDGGLRSHGGHVAPILTEADPMLAGSDHPGADP